MRRSAAPNCEVVALEDGTCAVATLRAIPEGEFFSVGFSDSDEGDFDQDDAAAAGDSESNGGSTDDQT